MKKMQKRIRTYVFSWYLGSLLTSLFDAYFWLFLLDLAARSWRRHAFQHFWVYCLSIQPPIFLVLCFFLQIRFCWSISPSERVTWISRLQFKEHFKEHATSRGRASKQHNDGAKTNTHHYANLVPMLRQWKYQIFQNNCPDNMLLIACKIQCETQVYSSKATVRPCKTKQMLCKTAVSPMSRPCKHRAMSCQKNPEPGDIDKHVSEKHARSKVKHF